MKTEAAYIRLACHATARGDDDTAAKYLGLAEESRRKAALREHAAREFYRAQASPQAVDVEFVSHRTRVAVVRGGMLP